jgi:hypothetical protein
MFEVVVFAATNVDPAFPLEAPDDLPGISLKGRRRVQR